jgi:hypothetical protein
MKHDVTLSNVLSIYIFWLALSYLQFFLSFEICNLDFISLKIVVKERKLNK